MRTTRTMIKSSFILLILSLQLSVTALAQNQRKTSTAFEILNTFVGEWEGNATLYYPRSEGKTERKETISVICDTVLKGTYIECNSIWKQTNGNTRELITYWNYDAWIDSFQILYLYDNWPGKVNYPLSLDSSKRMFVGYDTFIARGGIPAEERVEWFISEDGNEIWSNEYNHYQTDPEGYWAKSFEFVWKRKH